MSANVPPGPDKSALGQLFELRKDFLGYLLRAAPLGDLVRLRPAPGVTIYLVTRPELVVDVLVTRAALFHKSAMTRRMVGKFLGNGLVLSEDEVHKAQRRAIQPAFHGPRISELEPEVAAAAEATMARWTPGEAIDIEPAMTGLALQVMACVLFGQAPAGEQGPALSHAMEQFADSMAQRFRSMPLPEWLPTARHRAERRAIAVLDAEIAARLSPPPERGLLADLLAAGLPAQEVRDHMATLYFAGHETTAKWLTWTLYLLAGHPVVQERLAASLSDDELLERVLQESLRLYPPTWLFDRETTEALTLGGFPLPQGATLYVSPWVAHRDPRYFPEPERFDPDRMSRAFVSSLPRGAFFPFGFGPRNCIGRGLAELVATVTLRTLLARWRFELVPGQTVRPQPAATLRPQDPLMLRVHPR